MSEGPRPYFLGAEPEELERLRHQHGVWRDLGDRVFDELGVGAGWKCLDAGCGPGLVLADLCERVGASGEVWGVDVSPVMLATASESLRAHGRDGVRLIEGDLLEAGLPEGHFDLAWSRWVLSFLPEPERAIERLVRCLKPGGHLAVLDYNHEGVGLFPPSRSFDTIVAATRELYAETHGDPWIGGRLPRLFREAGLELSEYRAEIRAGGPGEPVFEWAARFFPGWAERFAARGRITPAERDEFLRDWRAHEQDPDARYFSPIVVTAVGRRAG